MFCKKLCLLLGFSSVFMFFGNVSHGTENINKNYIFIDETSDDYKCVKYNMNKNITFAAHKYNGDNYKNYWAYKAITNKNDRFYNSIKTLTWLMTYDYDEGRKLSDFINNVFFEKLDDFIKKFEEKTKDAVASSSWLKTNDAKTIFGYINFYTIACIMKLAIRKTKYPNKEELWKHAFNDLCLRVFDFKKDSDGNKLYKWLVSIFGDDSSKLQEYIKHDWNVYLMQFNVISTERGDISNGSVSSALENYKSFLKKVDYNSVLKQGMTAELISNSLSPIKDLFSQVNNVLQKTKFSDDMYKLRANIYDTDYQFLIEKYAHETKEDLYSINSMYIGIMKNLLEEIDKQDIDFYIDPIRKIGPSTILRIVIARLSTELKSIKRFCSSEQTITRFNKIILKFLKYMSDCGLCFSSNQITNLLAEIFHTKDIDEQKMDRLILYIKNATQSRKSNLYNELLYYIKKFFINSKK